MNYDKIILELLNRIATLEEKVAMLEQSNAPNYPYTQPASNHLKGYMDNSKDTTKYIYNGRKYGKGRLVLAVVKDYVNNNPNITINHLKMLFPKELQGSHGVVRSTDDARMSCSDAERRFYFSPDEIIHCKDGDVVVCTQWGKFNIDNFINRIADLDIVVEAV